MSVEHVFMWMVAIAGALVLLHAIPLGVIVFIHRRELDMQYVFLGIREQQVSRKQQSDKWKRQQEIDDAYKRGYIEGLRDSSEYSLVESRFQLGPLPKHTFSLNRAPATPTVSEPESGEQSK